MKYSGLNVVFLCVFVALFVGSLFLIRAQFNVGEVARPDVITPSGEEGSLVPVALAEYVNVRGEKWRVVRGTYDFVAAVSADTYPQIVSGVLDPLDVEPGETQTMRLVVNDMSTLSEVYAEVGHDKGKDIVPLKLVSAGAVSRADQFKNDFFFDEIGVLTTREEWATAHKENVASLIASAEAQSVRQYVYEGEWLVHDTHKTTYRTTFYVKNEAGQSTNIALAWSDPVCTIDPITHWLTGACNLTGTGDVDGIDGFNLLLNGQTINLSSGAKFGMAPGNSVTKNISAGGITLGPSGSKGTLVKQYVYYEDWDGDGYPSSSLNRLTNSAAAWSQHVRMSAAPGTDKRNPTLDCYDRNSAAKPGQTAHFTANRGDGSFDYNCNGGTATSTEDYIIVSTTTGITYYATRSTNPDGSARGGGYASGIGWLRAKDGGDNMINLGSMTGAGPCGTISPPYALASGDYFNSGTSLCTSGSGVLPGGRHSFLSPLLFWLPEKALATYLKVVYFDGMSSECVGSLTMKCR